MESKTHPIRRLRAGQDLPSRLREEVRRRRRPGERSAAQGEREFRAGEFRPDRVAAVRELLARGGLETDAALTRAAEALLGLRSVEPA